MNNRFEIEKEAKAAYDHVFKEREEMKDDIDHKRDVIIDQKHMKEEINMKKNDKEKEMQSLDVLKEHLNQEAKQAYEHAFKDREEENSHIDNYREVVLDKDQLMHDIESKKSSRM